MNEDMNQVVKFIVDFHRGQLKRIRDRADGLTVAVLKGKFKVQLKNSLCFALLRKCTRDVQPRNAERDSTTVT